MSELPIHWETPYNSRRSPVLACNAVATTQPLAAQAGLRMLLTGGNAVDAAVATAIALTVVEPTMNGIGSDAFAIVCDGNELHGLNASGHSPRQWNAARFAGHTQMPTEGWDCVTVPGVVSAWASLSEKFGKLPFAQLFEPAVEYAESGYALSPIVAAQWAKQAPRLKEQPGFAETFLFNGRVPTVGERVRLPDHARTLQEIAASHGDAFYRGELADKIAADSARHGGAMTIEDLASHSAEWINPIRSHYRALTLHELPPNGQGIAALMACEILNHFDLSGLQPESAEAVHLQVEAMKLALADVYRYVTDPEAMQIPVSDLRDPAYLRKRAGLIDLRQAKPFAHGLPGQAETVYLTAADACGMMVSFIQSNYMGFGSGVVVPGTGISLHNRGASFQLQPDHPNCVAGGKRPLHTIIPGFVTHGEHPLMSFGVMGADMQAQGHLQMMVRTADFMQNPQATADAPRWKTSADQTLLIESTYGERVLKALADLGHKVVEMPYGSQDFGAAQLIRKLPFGYAAASEPRRDGQAVGY
ncbi:MAG: gamma-glutamyltransferase family protein [Betaproteobacteria bacterium]|nr:MAG: gamma-glutamyltransferase family protein [Betaproteobacteria bacterium]